MVRVMRGARFRRGCCVYAAVHASRLADGGCGRRSGYAFCFRLQMAVLALAGRVFRGGGYCMELHIGAYAYDCRTDRTESWKAC